MSPILIDISRSFYTRLIDRIPTGIDRVGLEYVRHYAERALAAFTLGPFSSILSAADTRRAFRLLQDRDIEPWLPAAWLALKGHLSWWAGAPRVDTILLNTGNVWRRNDHYARELIRKGASPVFFVHDILPVTLPEFFPPGEDERHLQRLQTILAVGKGIIVNSRDTRDALDAFAAEQGRPLPPVAVARLGHNLFHQKPGARPIREPYFVIVGTIEPRKNHWMLLQLWRRLVEQYGELAPRIVVIGQRGWECENVVDVLDRGRRLRGFVIERGRCADDELVTWLHHAQALLFPSFAEGYGMPLNEALSLGVPVIASDLPVFREIAGDIPEYASPLDGPRWLELITDYARPGSALRAAQLQRISRFEPMTWDQHFRIVDDFLAQLDVTR